jgi:microcystin-dependent protein
MDGYIGQIILFAGTFEPLNWAYCDGRLLSISQNQALFAIIGTTYGGDGRSNFALPDLRGRVPVSTGNGPGRTPRVLGQYGGEESVSLTLNQLPTHNHLASASVPASANGGDNSSPVGNIPAVISADSGSLNAYTSTSKATGSLAAGTGSPTSNTGGNQAHDNMQPYLCLSYIICLSGIFPSRP